MGLVQKAFSDIITFSRSSNATRVGPTGLVEYAPHNLALRSQEFDNASWTKTRSSVTANAIAAPDGTVTADKLVEDTTASNTHLIVQSIAMGGSVDSSRFAFSIFAKAGERSRIRMFDNNQNSSGDSTFNLSAGTVVTGSGTITNVGNGWYRCTIYPLKDFSTTSTVFIQLDNGSTTSYTGDGTSGIYLWGAQLAVGPYALDYTPTTSAAVYGPRFDYDPVTLAARGLLIEEQRTNLLLRSEELDNAYWTKGASVSVSANASTAPDGVITADSVTFTGTGATTQVYRTVTVTSGAAYTISLYIKYISGANGDLLFSMGSDTTRGARITVTSTSLVISEVGANVTSSGFEQIGNGWFRVYLTITSTSTSFEYNLFRPVAYGGAGANVFLLWGAQLEAGSFATSYIPTLASTVTRSADVASVNTLSPWFSNVEGTLYLEASRYATAANNEVPVSLDDTGGASSRMSTYTASSTNVLGEFIADGGATQANLATSAVTNNVPFKFGIAYKANDFAASKDGATVVTDTSGTVPTILRMTIGASFVIGAASQYNGHVRRIAFYPRRLTNAELQALSA